MSLERGTQLESELATAQSHAKQGDWEVACSTPPS